MLSFINYSELGSIEAVAKALGLNYDSEKLVMYKGDNSNYGIYFGFQYPSTLRLSLYNGDISNVYTCAIGSSTKLAYKKHDDDVIFGIITDSNYVRFAVCKAKDANDESEKYVYIHNNNSANTNFCCLTEDGTQYDYSTALNLYKNENVMSLSNIVLDTLILKNLYINTCSVSNGNFANYEMSGMDMYKFESGANNMSLVFNGGSTE